MNKEFIFANIPFAALIPIFIGVFALVATGLVSAAARQRGCHNRLHSLAQPLLEDLRKEFPYIVAGTLMAVVWWG